MHLYQNGKRIVFNNKTWNLIKKKEGIKVDWKSFNKIWNNKFLIQSFMWTIDLYRCRKYYIQILNKFGLNKRISVEPTKYARKKKAIEPNEIKESIHYITLFKSEKVCSLKNMEDYQLTINESDKAISIKNERKSIEKEINYLLRKVDRFRIWKEKFTNMKEIIDILDLVTLNTPFN
jgi:hypothetical protein